MVDVRARNTGSFDHKTKCWRLRGKGIHATIGQLQKMYGVVFRSETSSQLERESAQWWRKYLQDVEDKHREGRKAASPLQDRIRSIEATISRFRSESRSTGDLERLLADTIALPSWQTEQADVPIMPPDLDSDLRTICDVAGITESDEQVVGLLHRYQQDRLPQTSPKNGMRHEADVIIERHKARGNKGWFQVRQAVDLVVEITGDVPPADVRVEHFREIYNRIKSNPKWGGTTQASILRNVRDFMKGIEADHNLNYGFLRNPAYKIKRSKGQKEKYTVEQVKSALANATGLARTALLLGLNTGAYLGDIASLAPDMIQDGHVVRTRAKLKHRTNPVVGSWLLWKETQAHLQFGVRQRRLHDWYSTFAKQHGLPPHKALRKTVAQMIHDDVGDAEAARLYRCEGLEGTHGGYYITDFTTKQVERLDSALRKVAEMLGIE